MIDTLDYTGKTKFGIDKIDVWLEIMPLFLLKDGCMPEKIDNALANITIFFFSKIGREFTKEENLNLLLGLANFMDSDPMTYTRRRCVSYLINLEFINE
jgi:hypothetical protein